MRVVLVVCLALLSGACGPSAAPARAVRAPGGARARALLASLGDRDGNLVRCEGFEDAACTLELGPHEPGSQLLTLERDGETIEGEVALRGTERSLAVDWYGETPSIARFQPAPGSVTLELAALDPAREHERQLPIVLLTNGSAATLRGTSIHGILFGTLHRRDEWGRWEQVGGSIGCGTVMGPSSLPPGERVEVDAPDFIGPRARIIADARYRFSIVLTADAGEWTALGAGELRGADAFPAFDFVELDLELTGAEILAAQALDHAADAGAASEAR